MTIQLTVDRTIDCQGLSCPMPIVRTKKAMDELTPGEVLEVVATDPGSVADVKSWASRVGHQFLGTQTVGELFRHFIRKAKSDEMVPETPHSLTVSNAELQEQLSAQPLLFDVREPMEYAFGHIPGAQLLPLGQLEQELAQWQGARDQEIYVICRTGNRSDLACQRMHELGFSKVYNVIPGMTAWEGPLTTTTLS